MLQTADHKGKKPWKYIPSLPHVPHGIVHKHVNKPSNNEKQARETYLEEKTTGRF
jgi:hypothetical protein